MKLMLVDDHPLFLEGLQNLLETHGIKVLGTASNGKQAITRACELKPDVVLMDIAMPVLSGLDAIQPIRQALPGVKIVMLTTFDDDENLFESIKRGASGYLLKNLNADELVSLLQALEHGDPPMSPGLAGRLINEFARQPANIIATTPTEQDKNAATLTNRQAEVLNLVAQGKTYKEVAMQLNLSERTIKYHMEKILETLQVENRSQAIARTARHHDK